MLNSKLLKLVRLLNSTELQNLSLKLLNSSTNTSKLYDYIIQFQNQQFINEKLSKEIVFDHLFRNQKYSESRLLKTMSELTKVIENVIIFRNIEEDIFYKKISLLKFYLHNNLDSYFETEHKELEKYLNLQSDNINLLYQKYVLEELSIEFKLKENVRDTNYNRLYENIYLIGKIGKIRIKNLSLISLKKELKEEPIVNNLYLAHIYANQLLDKNEDEYFYKCSALVFDDSNNIAKNELRTIILLLINYCIVKINQKQSVFLKHLFNLYSFKIKNGIVLEENNTIASSAYKNIVTISLRLNEIEFVETFLQKFTPFLPVEIKDEVYNYNYAQLIFKKCEYNNVLTVLRNYNFKDIFYKLGARRLQIKCFYLLQETDGNYYDVLVNALNAFKKNIYTNKELTEHYIQNDKAFLKFMNKIITIKDEKDIHKILKELEIATQTAEYDWIYETVSKKLKCI